MEMGRPKTVFLELPPRMKGRTLKRGTIRYYYTGGGRAIPLGSDLNKARLEWARLENGGVSSHTTAYTTVADRWEREAIHKGVGGCARSFNTQIGYNNSLVELRKAFKGFQLEEIRPKHIRQYLDKRTKKISANREITVLSIIFNWARELGLTDASNPCVGVSRNRERARERYVTDAEYKELWDKAPPVLQDAMDLAYLTGQRPSDVLKMTRQDIRDGCLWVVQNKTGVRMGIRVEGELKAVLERILTRPHKVASMSLICGQRGQPLTIDRLRHVFLKCRTSDWQFRDLRAKAATDAGSIKHAQRLLGHRTETTTAGIYRRVKGNIVGPLK